MLSAVKPTGTLHIGNYFGAMRQFLEFQDNFRTFVMIADYHALTSVHDAKEMRDTTLDLAIGYLATGLDPAKTIMFKQSEIPEHAELAWMFNCLTTMPYLMRAHAFKDAEAKNKDINVGVFDYPMLMAADILLYDTDVVPVGEDQRQHLEIARDMSRKFNATFGATFKEPEEFILKDVAVVPGTDGRKMSKSYGNTIPLFGTTAEVKKAVMSIVTDSKGASDPKDPEACNVFAIHKLVATKEELKQLADSYKKGAISYKESKELLVERLENVLAPLRKRRTVLAEDPALVKQILKNGADIARDLARSKMRIVKEKAGLI